VKATIRKRGRASLIQKGATSAAKLTKITPEREIVQRLQYVLAEIDRLPLLTGSLGCQALDCFELVDKIRARYRERARKLLLEQPGAIPNWHCSETPQRVLSKDTARVFDALALRDDMLTPKRFIGACTVSLSAIRKLITELNPDMSPDEVEFTLNRALVDLISYDSITRLSRAKDRQLKLELDI
jgi:hypothetical protein